MKKVFITYISVFNCYSRGDAFKETETAVLEGAVLASCGPRISTDGHIVAVCLDDETFLDEVVRVDVTDTLETPTEDLL